MKRIVLQLLFAALCFNAVSQGTIIQYLSGTDKDHTVQWDFFCTEGRKSGQWTKIAVPSNWKQAGEVHQGAFYRFKYDITELLKPSGKNLLEVTVAKTSADASVNNAERKGDFWIFGGIYRPVYLEVVPEIFIDRMAVDARADGSFRMDVYAKNLKGGKIIEGQVQMLNGENVGQPFTVEAATDSAYSVLKSNFKNPLLWNAEFPNLYRVKISVKKQQTIIHSNEVKFGFRTVELRKNDGLYVNGTKIVLKGVNRHSFWPETGRTLSHDLQLMDA